MPIAFVLINSEIGEDLKVLEELTTISHVSESHLVYGIYDVIAKVEAKTMDQLKEVITSKIRSIDQVRTTLTMIVMK
jgi:DNA-binding Lrp family transcriptional regulator